MNTEIADQELLSALVSNLGLIDEMYQRYQADPTQVDPGWRRAFGDSTDSPTTPQPRTPSQQHRPSDRAPPPMEWVDGGPTTVSLVQAYRAHGHLAAHIDPLEMGRPGHPDLEPSAHGLSEDTVASVQLPGLPPQARVAQILSHLREIYCGTIGTEFMHIENSVQRNFLLTQLEERKNRFRTDRAAQKTILRHLTEAELLERFLHTKYVGTKRFSLEGGETLLPLLHLIIAQSGEAGVDEVVMGMAHRGRLNVLTNLIGKSPSLLFAEFDDIDPESVLGSGDVKYHMGYSSDYQLPSGKVVHLSLAFNPSHLEAVDPVVVGRVRAKQRRRKDHGREKVLGVLIHGDAAFAGQGLVAETLNLSGLHGYRTGGTIHVVVNNQIGFTTNPIDSRSTHYCTDVAKMLQVPIFHVNGDDPEAVAHVVELACEYRQRFHTDVIIDMLCFRKYGHNESDDPGLTQPLLYQKLERHPSVRDRYARELISRSSLTKEDELELVTKYNQFLEQALKEARASRQRPRIPALKGYWNGYLGGRDSTVPDVDTGVALDALASLAERISQVPAGFTVHPRLLRTLQQRGAMGRGEIPVDWGMGEMLTYASLLSEGTLVRLSGQDVRRGTFSHRHAVLIDYQTGVDFTPLNHLQENQGEFRIYDSLLSEAAVLGFEYGYSLDYPDGLVMWEAQFGDFVNGAQVILDQFISSAEDKWARLSGLVMLLPHGYEGQGPEHSSARFERFLQLCAEDNMMVACPTTPAQLFHLLRRQVHRKWRKPLVILSPKSFLRHKLATSKIADFASGRFQAVLPDEGVAADQVKRIFVCTGKVYFDLHEERERRGDKETALVRLEQIYPLRGTAIQAVLARYPNATEVCLVQEEPENMGARFFLLPRFASLVGNLRLRAVSREEGASPATGSHKAHLIEQKSLLKEAFEGGR